MNFWSSVRRGAGAVGRSTAQPPAEGASQLDDQVFLQLSDLLYRVREARVAVGLARRRMWQAAPRLGRSLSYLRSLPTLHVEVSDSPAGRAIADALSGRRGLVPATMAAAVLELPAEPEAYLVGRSRQAVRTGLNHARREGLSVRKVTDEDERRARARELAEGRIGVEYVSPLQAWAAEPRHESWFAVDSEGRTLAVAIVTVDGPVARLDAMISTAGNVRSPVRYLLSAHVFMDLIAAQVSHVILEGSLFLSPGLLHFQRLLGFRPMNIRLRRSKDRAADAGAAQIPGRRLRAAARTGAASWPPVADPSLLAEMDRAG